MKVHKHVGVIEAADRQTLEEALAIAAAQHEVLCFLAPNVAVLERETARKVAGALTGAGMHPKVVE
ncbi:MAG: hypothetical protein L6Q71_10320 [Planctomycetes bacterium]|nr:hypothetical protein [Planctomycetota bacterium]NUQ34818.1 hypothetical protein [Planctomycetaceae bacterium]